MPKITRDPIRSIKSYLRDPERADVRGIVAQDLREIGRRLARARQIDGRLKLSGRLEEMFRIAELPLG
jgi:hypothetical protein